MDWISRSVKKRLIILHPFTFSKGVNDTVYAKLPSLVRAFFKKSFYLQLQLGGEKFSV
ncbi:hypothetical protein LIT38_13065 [Bacillus sp. CMF12]|uniref:hypothetical protein n=1 Tax=Bacillus sp. CMF12 TaxID=2884834 RepID=UPI00207A536B|nr:hypothetical protein [Bacillus sp. CMF12]USK52315.1 hypothetical protein LIT38_13065 [Bacillus sp. CMF12]